MNRAYRLVWSDLHGAFVAVAEFARARGKRASSAVLAAGLIAVLPGLSLAANLPEGGRIVAGSGSITQSGNTMTVSQSTDRMAADWQSFSIGQGYAVNFVQPSASSIALNRVLGSDVSRIQGSLTANGQVFLINPNGVLFSPTARVEVGGLIASTRDLSVSDFMAGNYRFSGSGNAAIRNEGEIKVGAGGTAAFIAARIENAGRIEAPQGHVLMAAADTVRLDLGGPVKLEVEKGALDALIEQGGAILADGGRVLLTAQAADELTAAVINHTGITEAKTLATGEQGEILLLADMKTGQLNVGGRLDASAPNGGDGGFVETSAAKVKVADDARITTQAPQGQTGTWLIDPNDYTIAASGGDITGAALSANLASSNVTIQSASGATSGNGDIFVRDNVTWTSGNTLTLSADRNIEILATLDASGGSGGKVALEYGQGAPASGNTASYSFGLTSSGFTGKINLQAGPNFTTKLGNDGTPIAWTVITSLGGAGDESSGPANSLQGLAYSSNLSGNFVLGADINASATSTWNGGEGFVPIGNGTNRFTGRFDGLGHTVTNLTINRSGSGYQGLFGATQSATLRNVGLVGGSVTGAYSVGGLVGYNYRGAITQSYATGSVTGNNDNVGGLVGYNYRGAITQSYATGSVTGNNDYVGGLVGINSSGTITQSYATGSVTGNNEYVGGLVGENYGAITQSYAAGSVTGDYEVGGLVGYNNGGAITQSYATGSVTGTGFVGGLVGINSSGTITQSYATGSVTGAGFVGGLVGRNNGGTVSESYWDTETTGQSTSAGGTGKTSAQMKQLTTFSGWDIDDQGGTSKIWRIYEGQSYPLLRGFLTPLTVTANSGSRTYDGTTASTLGVSYSTPPNATLLGTATVTADGKDVGSRTLTVSGLYSNQWGYDISYATGTLTITPKALTASYTAADKVYDGTTAATVSGTSGDIVASDDLTITASGSFDNKNVGTGKTVNVSGGALSGADAGNYFLQNSTGTASADITPKALSLSGLTANDKTYDGTTAATLSSLGTLAGVIGSDDVSVSGTASASFADKNAGTGKTVTVSGLALTGTDAGNYSLGSGATTTASILPKPLTIAGSSAADKVYDGTTTASVTAGTLSGFVGSETVTVASATGTFADKNAGTNKNVTASYTLADGTNGGLASNYTLADETLQASITPKALTASYSAANKVYDGTTTAAVSATSGDIVSGDTVNITASGAFADKNAGTNKTVNIAGGTLAGADAGNYFLQNATGTATADITPRPVVVTADAKNKTEGQPDPALTYSTGCAAGQTTDCGLVAGESLAGSLTRDAGEAVGAYAIRQGTVTDANNPNYAIAYVGADLTITAASSGGSTGGGDPLDAALASVQTTAGNDSGAAGSGGGNAAPGGEDGGGNTGGGNPQGFAGAGGGGGITSPLPGLLVVAGGIRLPEGILPDEEEWKRK